MTNEKRKGKRTSSVLSSSGASSTAESERVSDRDKHLQDVKNDLQTMLDLMGPETPDLEHTLTEADTASSRQRHDSKANNEKTNFDSVKEESDETASSTDPTANKESGSCCCTTDSSATNSESRSSDPSGTNNLDTVPECNCSSDSDNLSLAVDYDSTTISDRTQDFSDMDSFVVKPNPPPAPVMTYNCMQAPQQPPPKQSTERVLYATSSRQSTSGQRQGEEWGKKMSFIERVKCKCQFRKDMIPDLYKVKMKQSDGSNNNPPKRLVLELVDSVPKPSQSNVGTNTKNSVLMEQQMNTDRPSQADMQTYTQKYSYSPRTQCVDETCRNLNNRNNMGRYPTSAPNDRHRSGTLNESYSAAASNLNPTINERNSAARNPTSERNSLASNRKPTSIAEQRSLTSTRNPSAKSNNLQGVVSNRESTTSACPPQKEFNTYNLPPQGGQLLNCDPARKCGKADCADPNCLHNYPPDCGIPPVATYYDTCGATRVDVYYFDHGNSAFYRTVDKTPTVVTDIVAAKTEAYTTKFWAGIFGTIHIGISFVISFILQLIRFLLYSILRPLIVGVLQLLSDYFFKPVLSTIFNSLAQPLLIMLYNVAASIRDLFEPIAQAIGYFLGECAVLLGAIRLVEVNNNCRQKFGTKPGPNSNSSEVEEKIKNCSTCC